jgi:hypothetical protein
MYIHWHGDKTVVVVCTRSKSRIRVPSKVAK